jgi:hypothetical protein
MKKQNPLFVAGFPYVLMFVGYLGFIFLNITTEENSGLNSFELALLLSCMSLFAVGVLYNLYWLLSTARVLKAKTKSDIPNFLLLIIPIASYWWLWRYSQASEKYVKNKVQGALIFILIALLGSIGNGIVQDYYNKQTPSKSGKNK